MKFFMSLRVIAFLTCFGMLSPHVLAADETRPVFLVRQAGENEVWTANMVLHPEALRLVVPVSFERAGTTARFILDTPGVSFRPGVERVLAQSGDKVLVRYDVVVEGATPLPRPNRRVTVRFTLAELGLSGSPAQEQPGSFALRKAILQGPYAKGRAWIQSIEFRNQRFIAVVGLKR